MPLVVLVDLLAGALPAAAARTWRLPGVVVVEVGTGGAAEKAGLLAEDVLLSWRRAASPPANSKSARGKLDTPFDLDSVEGEQAPRGPVTLTVERQEKRFELPVPPGSWGLTVRPRFAGEDLADWLEGGSLVRASQEAAGRAEAEPTANEADKRRLAAGLARWEALAARLAALREQRTSWWVQLRMAAARAVAGETETAHRAVQAVAEAAEQAGDWLIAANVWVADGRRLNQENQPGQAADALRRALAASQRASSESLDVAAILNGLGLLARYRGDLAAAEDLHHRSLAIQEKLAPESLNVAMSLNNLGIVAWTRGDLATAEDSVSLSLAIKEKLAPESLSVASSLASLGMVARDRGDLAAAEDFHRRALSIEERLVPESLAVASELNSLGIVAKTRGDLATAEGLYRRALRLHEKLAPDSLHVASSLNNLGTVARDRGDLATAEDLFRRSLAITERLAPKSLEVARGLNNLGRVARDRGDLANAEDFFRRSLAIHERLAPESLAVAGNLTSLGSVARNRGDVAAAEDFYRRALRLQEKLAPDSLSVARSLNNLGIVARDRGDLAAAEDLYRRSLAIKGKLAPDSLEVAIVLANLGDLAEKQGDQAEAARYLGESLRIFRRLAPGSTNEAEVLYSLGALELKLGRKASAADYWRQAIDSLEAQQGRLGGSQESRTGFAAQYADWYREYSALLVELGRPAEAFHLLERSRARGLLALLAERDLVLATDIPEELERERKIADADYDRAQARLGEQAASNQAAIERIAAEMRDIRRRQDDIRERVRQASPHLGSLFYPEPLDLAGARAALDPGTLLLVYSLGETSGHLFLVGPGRDDFRVVGLPVARQDLAEQVERLRLAIRAAAASGDSRLAEAVRATASALSETVLGPAAGAIASAERLLIVPDGPLHVLPFAALADPGSREFRWLVEAKPIHSVVSMTVYQELLGWRHPTGETARMVAFGDPIYPSAVAGRVRGALAPLPATRAEVEALAALAPEATVAYLGREATEGRAKALGRDVGAVHFACHGVLDERFPLDSGLALSLPEQAPDIHAADRDDNGLMQAWEVFETVRLDADLVTLSACETAMGKEMGGEGLVGLTRAFEYAGARSVLASLWSVADESTATLMESFYRHWRAGLAKDEALRQAQRDLIRGPVPVPGGADSDRRLDASQPFFWAAFQLYGDWR